MSLRDKLLKNSTIKETSILSESKFFKEKDTVLTPVPMINVALSGSIYGGLVPGITTLAGPSKHFKTAFSLLMATSFLKKYPDGILMFYDTEFGTPESYFDSFAIDKERVIHTPLLNIEQMKHEVVTQLDGLDRNDRVCIIIDSIGNIASKKELDDALEGKGTADMTRAKQLKSFGRMVTPYLTIKNIPMICVNHTYKTQEMYSKDVVSGGTGIYYASDNIWIIGRQQDKEEGKELRGYDFIINIEKSRYIREKSKIPVTVLFEGGIDRFSGLFDIALSGNYIASPSKGYYQLVDRSTGELVGNKLRRSEMESDAKLWTAMFKDTDFPTYIESSFKLSNSPMISEDQEAFNE